MLSALFMYFKGAADTNAIINAGARYAMWFAFYRFWGEIDAIGLHEWAYGVLRAMVLAAMV